MTTCLSLLEDNFILHQTTPFLFSGAVLFFVLFSLRSFQLYGVVVVGRIRDPVTYGLRTGNRRGMNGGFGALLTF